MKYVPPVYFSLPLELAKEVPTIFLESLRGMAGMISVEADGVSEHSKYENVADDPVKALNAFIELAEGFRVLLSEAADEIPAMIESARSIAHALAKRGESADEA